MLMANKRLLSAQSDWSTNLSRSLYLTQSHFSRVTDHISDHLSEMDQGFQDPGFETFTSLFTALGTLFVINFHSYVSYQHEVH